MIYEADDIVERYKESLACLLKIGTEAFYSTSYMERTISYSSPFSEFENGNSRKLAFDPILDVCKEIFPEASITLTGEELYGQFGWMADCYIRLALGYRPVAFEFLFLIFPIKELMEKYKLYHEMDFSEIESLYKERISYSKLDLVMKRAGMSTSSLVKETGLPLSTIRSLRFGYRRMAKAEAETVLKIASAIGIKPLTLL